MRHPPRAAWSTTALFLAAASLAACASSGTTEIAGPDPIDIQRGWKIYVHREDGAVAGIAALPQHPSASTRPEEILMDIAGAFCVPVLDKSNEAPDERLRDFCLEPGRPEGRGRVVLAPDWGDAPPPHPDCFIHCVCEGYAPLGDDPAERARESATGPCTNRLNCRVDCPATGSQ